MVLRSLGTRLGMQAFPSQPSVPSLLAAPQCSFLLRPLTLFRSQLQCHLLREVLSMTNASKSHHYSLAFFLLTSTSNSNWLRPFQCPSFPLESAPRGGGPCLSPLMVPRIGSAVQFEQFHVSSSIWTEMCAWLQFFEHLKHTYTHTPHLRANKGNSISKIIFKNSHIRWYSFKEYFIVKMILGCLKNYKYHTYCFTTERQSVRRAVSLPCDNAVNRLLRK